VNRPSVFLSQLVLKVRSRCDLACGHCYAAAVPLSVLAMSHDRTPRSMAKSTHHRPSHRMRNVATRAFVAMSFHEEEEPALVDYWHAMERAAKRARGNFDLRRIDKLEGDYDIVARTYKEINAADLVIADLTLSSANVYLELGYARGRGKSVIQTCREGTPLEFDIRGHRTLMYPNATVLEEKLLSRLNALKSGSATKGCI
jgi:hypothetical protein